MFFSTLILFPLTLFFSFCHKTKGNGRQYECGPHGRFEYCIDGIPGCVVGCHCHPGYYFDTDSKICESNNKLQQEIRRHYMSEMSHMNTPAVTPIATPPAPTPTPETNTRLDEKVDEIAKDTDDIGDWLYNQFFKTIENQVINKTSNEIPKKITRRSGSGPPAKKSKRKSRKSWKDSKRKKGKVHGLRRKLLRITEDDSLFDSGSSSDDEISSTSSESDSSDTSTSESNEKKRDKDDKEHGHSTLLLFNKKQPPPLPSFIFLPNMGSPFYPPIGLPPPPVLPMYPMVPVPPMAPMFPYSASNTHNDNKNNDAACSTSANKTNSEAGPKDSISVTPKEEKKEQDNPKSPPVDDTDPKNTDTDPKNTDTDPKNTDTDPKNTDTDPKNTDPKFKLRYGKKSRKGNVHLKEPYSETMFRDISNKESRKKLMHQIREKMKNKMSQIYQHNNEQDGDSRLLNDLSSQETYSLSKNIHLRSMDAGNGMPKMKDVDFKYLSELIHRANFNEPSKVPHYPTAPSKNPKETVNTGPVARRSYQNEPAQQYTQQLNSVNEPRNLQASGTDNAFYSNLGRQIASMIRNIDSQGERQVNIEIERTNPVTSHTILNENSPVISHTTLNENSPVMSHTILNENNPVMSHTILNENSPIMSHTILNNNRYAPRSYWERSVRSPLHYFKEKMEYLNPSNEKILYSLEKEVETAANSSPSLSLHELEDILSTMSKAQFQIQQKVMFEQRKPNLNHNNTSLNINLLPNHEGTENYKKMFYEAPNHNEHIAKANVSHPKPNKVDITVQQYNNITVQRSESSDTINKSRMSKYLKEPVPADFWWLDMVKSIPVREAEINKSISYFKPIYDIKPTRRTLTDEISTTFETIQTVPKRHHMDYLKFIKSVSHNQLQQAPTTIIPNLNYHTQVLNYLTYFPKSHNDYGADHKPIMYPEQISSFTGSVNTPIQKPMRRPSYFHHELHHFDYFE